MKTEYLFVILLVLIGFSSCEDSTSDATLELSQSTFENISSDGATLTVNITSSDGSPDKPGGLSIQLCKSEKKEFYIRYSS